MIESGLLTPLSLSRIVRCSLQYATYQEALASVATFTESAAQTVIQQVVRLQ